MRFGTVRAAYLTVAAAPRVPWLNLAGERAASGLSSALPAPAPPSSPPRAPSLPTGIPLSARSPAYRPRFCLPLPACPSSLSPSSARLASSGSRSPRRPMRMSLSQRWEFLGLCFVSWAWCWPRRSRVCRACSGDFIAVWPEPRRRRPAWVLGCCRLSTSHSLPLSLSLSLSLSLCVCVYLSLSLSVYVSLTYTRSSRPCMAFERMQPLAARVQALGGVPADRLRDHTLIQGPAIVSHDLSWRRADDATQFAAEKVRATGWRSPARPRIFE